MNNTSQEQFISILTSSIKEEDFVKLTLTKYRGAENSLNKIISRIIKLKSGIKLSLTYQYQTKEIIKNYSIDEGIASIDSLLINHEFMISRIFTLKRDVQIEYSKNNVANISFFKPTFPDPDDASIQDHDRKKTRWIKSENNLYLTALGVTNKQGEVVRTMEKKFKQINKFIEIIHGLIKSSDLKNKNQLSVVDMGSGKGYLTFSLYDFLTNTLGKKAQVTGVENRLNLVEFCNSTAKLIEFENLHFKYGDIKGYEAEQIDITMALHACDTATDDAIFKGIKSSSSLIILAPCCHKQIRKEINPASNLKELLKFGILLERQSEIVTDGLRALLLELHGYETQVFEFVSPEHTSKNIMIVGIKNKREINKAHILNQINEIKKIYGIKFHYLELLLLPELVLYPKLSSH
jgi:SAM-dependent methyltransferase